VPQTRELRFFVGGIMKHRKLLPHLTSLLLVPNHL